ncbi:hypothetical protein BDV96DRAFT_574837 [Lophiotrema nucula]|uniref:Short-chain dehydrogenase n=1 Tax=Lophiotrema nucula TaxID=690887 RepID=A0A6A5Z920_9PLEO|nr:hypothetical protein BDV96DRAFT_574837 [Lophiotrema nucula]
MPNLDFGHGTTAEEASAYHTSQIKGKTVLITGVSPGGIGLYTAKAIAIHSPSLIILAARSDSSLLAASTELAEAAPNTATRTLKLDLSSNKAVREAAAEVNSWSDVAAIDVLINNAGIMMTPWGKNEDGIESQFGTNHIGHWLFTNLIIDKIIAAKGRIVNLSSAGHRFGPVRYDDWNFKDGVEYDPQQAYGQAKTANILHAQGLAERLESKGITAYSVHPGAILTNLGRHVGKEGLIERGILNKDGTPNLNGPIKFKSLSQGSSSTIVAAFDQNIIDHNGAYFVDCQIVDEEPGLKTWATGKENADKLWELSEKLVGEEHGDKEN